MICNKFEMCIHEAQGSNNQCISCRSETSNSNISCSENGRRYNLENDIGRKVVSFKIDGGVFTDENSCSKCDNLLYIEELDKPTVIFIELKGKNILHGLEQLQATAEKYNDLFQKSRKAFRIVCSGAPRIGNGPQIIKLKNKLYKAYGVMPVIKERVISEKYSKLLSE